MIDMVKCEDCKQEMLKEGRKGCSYNIVALGTKIYYRVPYAIDEQYVKKEDQKEYNHCHDCGVEWGCVHHMGCDMEECPVCGGQLGMGCDCNKPIYLMRGTITGCRCIPIMQKKSI